MAWLRIVWAAAAFGRHLDRRAIPQARRATPPVGMLADMHFDLVDRVLESSPERIVTLKCVSGAEEYLQDHFPTFPVLPGVMMIESMVQAARRMLELRDPALGRHVLGQVKALKYGAFVRPGDAMRVEVTLHAARDDGSFDFKGSAQVIRAEARPEEPPVTSVSGRFSLRPPRLSA